MARNTSSRSLHDLGLAAWFGGTLANAVALNPAAARAGSDADTGAVANDGWNRWTPVNAAAIGAHLVGSIGMLGSDADRVAAQDGVGSTALAKTGLTAAALGATAWSRSLGKTVAEHEAVPAGSGTTPSAATPPDVAAAQKKLAVLQWVVPALTGTLVVLSALAGEQQRPAEQRKGFARSLVS